MVLQHRDWALDDFTAKLLETLNTLGAPLDGDLAQLLPLLREQDGAYRLARELPDLVTHDQVSPYGPRATVWECLGQYYLECNRPHEALPVFEQLYEHMLKAQAKQDARVGKGTPLVRISDCHLALGRIAHAKRFLMLTLCEDAISHRGDIRPQATGVYYRVVWGFGLSDPYLRRWATECYRRYQCDEKLYRFPENLLLDLDQEWMVESPAQAELGICLSSGTYVEHMLSQTRAQTKQKTDGKALERLCQYLVSCIPGYRTRRDVISKGAQLDVVGVYEGPPSGFRSEEGKCLIAECKDWARKADVGVMLRLAAAMDAARSGIGLLFSTEGISGQDEERWAAREQQKFFQRGGKIILVVEPGDIERVAQGVSFLSILREKYEALRFDLG